MALTARDSLAAAEWLRLVASPGAELESAAAAQLSEPGGDPARRQIALQLLGWARGLAAVEPQARDLAESSDLRVRRRRLAAAAAVVARGLDGWQSVQHAAKLDRWPSKWILEARCAELLQKLRSEVGIVRESIAVVPGLGALAGPLGPAQAELERLRKQPDDLVLVSGAWRAPAREALLSLVRSLGGAGPVDDAILRATGIGVASDGASQSQPSDLGPRVTAGDYSVSRAATDAAKEVAQKVVDGSATGLDVGKALGIAGLLLGVGLLLGGGRSRD